MSSAGAEARAEPIGTGTVSDEIVVIVAVDSGKVAGESGIEEDVVDRSAVDGAVAGRVVEAKELRRAVETDDADIAAVGTRLGVANRVLERGVARAGGVPVARARAAFFSSQRCHATSTIEALKMEEYKPEAMPTNIARTKL